jgi:hypothetical protein
MLLREVLGYVVALCFAVFITAGLAPIFNQFFNMGLAMYGIIGLASLAIISKAFGPDPSMHDGIIQVEDLQGPPAESLIDNHNHNHDHSKG